MVRCHSLQIDANDADKVETGLYRYKKAVIKKENGQIPFPTDRALNDANKMKTGLYRDKKAVIKKRRMVRFHSLQIER